MANSTTSELADFIDFAAEQLRGDGHDLTPEEVVDLWRVQNPRPEELERDVAAVKAALKDMEAGDRGQPLDEFDRAFRIRHNLPERS